MSGYGKSSHMTSPQGKSYVIREFKRREVVLFFNNDDIRPK